MMRPLDTPFWSIGFRPFFLLGPLWGLLAMALWITAYAGGVDLPGIHLYWHAHEMLHGFTVAVVIGFLLTATQNWTGIRGVHGAGLVGLASIWLAGRVMMLFSTGWPLAAAVVDLAFLPVCVWLLRIYFKGPNRRNLPLLGAVAALWAGNLLYHLNMIGVLATSLRASLYLTAYVVVFMIVVIGGRVIPFFASRVLPGGVQVKTPLLDRLAVLTAAAFAFTPFCPWPYVTAGVAAAAAVVNGCRCVKWHDWRIWRHPILFILYIGFAWAIAGFVAAGAASLRWLPESTAVHVFTAGAISTMILGMIARVSLGHTGRTITATRAMQAAFACVVAAGGARIVVFRFGIDSGLMVMIVSAALWIAAFGLFVATYFKILRGPRVSE